MPSQSYLDKFYIDITDRIAQRSHAVRAKVGSVLVKDDNIISYGYNGTPKGYHTNVCEITNEDGSLITSPSVIHAEANCLVTLARTGNGSSLGSTMYVTYSPCMECAKLITQSGIAKVVYKKVYRENCTDGIVFLLDNDIIVEKFEEIE
jgi:dCMP deaminase